MNSYPGSLPGSASSLAAQYFNHAAAVSAASAGAGVGVDSLTSSQLSTSGLSSVGSATTTGLSDIARHPWLVTGMDSISKYLFCTR